MANGDDPDDIRDDHGGEGHVDPGVARALELRFGRTRRAAGAEPQGLEEVALYVDGALPESRRRAIEERLRAEPELREVVDELERLERETERADNVVPFVIPSGRARRVGATDAGRPGTPRALPLPERNKSPLRLAVVGIGAALALAAVLFLVTRPAMQIEGESGAGLSGRADAIAIGFEPGHAVIEVDAGAPGEVSVMLATPAGTRALGLCEARSCLVTQDTLPIRAGKTTVRAALAADVGPCAYVLALTAKGGGPSTPRSAAYVDPHAVARTLGTVVSGEGCLLESASLLDGLTGARHVAFMKVP